MPKDPRRAEALPAPASTGVVPPAREEVAGASAPEPEGPGPNPEDEQFGFRWGPLVVRRAAIFPEDRYVLTVYTDAGQSLDIYCSPKGGSLRVFKKSKGEMKCCTLDSS